MRVKAKLSRIEYDNRGKPIVLFKRYCFYLAFVGLDGTFTVADTRSIPIKFTKDEFNRFFEIVEVPKNEPVSNKPKDIYVIEYGSSYSSDPWEIVGYVNTKEEALDFINKQFYSALYHYSEVKHVSQIKEED